MRRTRNLCLETLMFAAFLLSSCGMALAQGSQGSQSGQAGQSQPPAQSTDKSKSPDVTPLSLDATPPPASAVGATASVAVAGRDGRRHRLLAGGSSS